MLLKMSLLSAVLAVGLGWYGFQEGFGETQSLMGVCRMLCTGCVFTTILFALGHFDKKAEES
jgi:hypothetical protein